MIKVGSIVSWIIPFDDGIMRDKGRVVAISGDRAEMELIYDEPKKDWSNTKDFRDWHAATASCFIWNLKEVLKCKEL